MKMWGRCKKCNKFSFSLAEWFYLGVFGKICKKCLREIHREEMGRSLKKNNIYVPTINRIKNNDQGGERWQTLRG